MTSYRIPTPVLMSGLAVAAIVGFVLLRNYDPNAAGNFFPKCIFKAVSGFDCVGCGLTRAMHALAHGDIARAFDMNPLAILVLPLIPMMILDGRGLTPRALRPFMAVAMEPKLWLFLLPTYWVVRNLPWWPFTWLAAG